MEEVATEISVQPGEAYQPKAETGLTETVETLPREEVTPAVAENAVAPEGVEAPQPLRTEAETSSITDADSPASHAPSTPGITISGEAVADPPPQRIEVFAPVPKNLPVPAEEQATSLIPARPTALPKPALPQGPDNLRDSSVVTVTSEPARKRAIPGWLISLLVMLVLLLTGVSLLLYLLPGPSSDQGAPATAAGTSAASSSVTPAGQHPLTKYVEIAGLRISVDVNRKSSIQYIVVNHSAAEVSDVALNVVVRSVNSKPQQPPVAVYAVRISSLGPFESREFTTPIETPVRALELPDWQNLHADVQVAPQ